MVDVKINPQNLGEDGRLYAAIREAGFNIRGFARRMDVHRTTLWRVDRGLQIPDQPDFYQRAAALLGVPEETINPHARTEVAA